MDGTADLATQFRRVLSIPKERRNHDDIKLIYNQLREMQTLSSFSDSTLQQMAKTSRYEVHDSNDTLYFAGDIARNWYILLSGAVFLDGNTSMCLPGNSFGQQTSSGRRESECLILERSEMIVIEYPMEKQPLGLRPSSFGSAFEHTTSQYPLLRDDQALPKDVQQVKDILQKSEPFMKGRSSDPYARGGRGEGNRRSSADEFDLDLSGLKETMVDQIDSDEDEEMVSQESTNVRDIVRDCLEKEPSERTEKDINILMDFMQHLPAFSKLTHNIKVEMCKVMVFAVVDNAGAVVMEHGEAMDSWSVILNGSVEILFDNKSTKTLHLGDSFGVKTSEEQLFHEGTMKTRCKDCQFVCIAQQDYWRIFSQGEASCRKVEEEGEVVMVTEHRVQDGGSRQGQVVIKGTPERLLDHLMEDHSVIDPTYVEDFLLTYVVFFNKSHEIAAKLLKWFERPQLKDKVTRVMLLWVNNHFSDFEGDTYMEACLERFEYLLEAKKMLGQLRLLNMACSAKSKPRIITLQRLAKETRLDFSICGGKERNFPIFVSKVDYDSKASDLGLKRGDQIIEVNGQSFEHITGARAMEFLMSHAHLCMMVKTNTIGFKEVEQPSVKKTSSNRSLDETSLPQQYNTMGPKLAVPKKSGGGTNISRSVSDVNFGKKNKPKNLDVGNHNSEMTHLSGSSTLPRNSKLKRAMMRFNFMPKSPGEKDMSKHQFQEGGLPFTSYFTGGKPGQERMNQQQPHPETGQQMPPSSEDTLDLNSQVIRVYRGDHTSRFFALTKDTIAKEVVLSALGVFGISDELSKSYFLCEVTVTEDGLIKQKRLPEQASNLANRISLNGRYYIKANISEGPISDEVAQEIAREASLNLLNLSTLDVAKELTLQDFEWFRNVDSREYIYNLLESSNERKSKNLRLAEQTTNTEMYWVITEVCQEVNIAKRVKLLKYFIKVAKYCKDFKNYNSMFAILSGLENPNVKRLKHTWEKMPQKHENILEDLLTLMDPSRNMSKYRNLFTGELSYPPIIPWFPIVKKDVTFLHYGNETKVDGLINFEKLRMLAREVRRVCKFCAIGYDPYKMEALPDHPEDNNVALSVVSIMTGAPNRRSGRGPIRDPKKAYEEHQTSRRIRQYLEGLSSKKYTEKELQEMSYNCEPPQTLNTPTSKQTLKPSPNTTPVAAKKKTSKDNEKPLEQRNDSFSSGSSRQDPNASKDISRRKLKMQDSNRDDTAVRSALPSDSSSASSRNGSLKSTNSTNSRNFLPPPGDYVTDENLDHFDDDHGQVSMV